MSIAQAKIDIEQYFIDTWTQTPIAFDGVAFNHSGVNDWISLKYVPIQNDSYAMDGNLNGRIKYNGQFQVFCYAENVPLTYALADDVISFLSSRIVGIGTSVKVGQPRGNAIDADNNFYEMLVTFEVDFYA